MNYTSSKKSPIYDFLVIVNDLKKSPFIKQTKAIKATLNHKKKEFTLNGFSEHHLRSALLDFRKLYMAKEPTNFNEICKLVVKINPNKNFIKKVNKLEAEWNKVLTQSTHYDETTLDSNKDVLDKWFYGHYFHRDKMKYDELNLMQSIKPVHKLVFVATILDLSGVVVELGALIESSSDSILAH